MRRAFFAVLLSLAAASAVTACGGAGGTCDPDTDTCDYTPTPIDTPFEFPTDAPTDSPTDSPPDPTRTPLPAGCVSLNDVDLLYPNNNAQLSSYANTVYLTFRNGRSPGNFLAVQFGFIHSQQTNPSEYETGTTIQNAGSSAPSYVPSPRPGFSGVYASSNLPLVPERGIQVLVVDTRRPARCDTLWIAGFNTFTQAVRRGSASRGLLPGLPGR
ncbi:MAG: hypothetical protein QOJ39_2745 [Candidatus Eremiobacteraeota bacterium]|jgi:hypothetical protein|nr:hypothetical protein [Candidatus Eremiobacteraeota bacterium]